MTMAPVELKLFPVGSARASGPAVGTGADPGPAPDPARGPRRWLFWALTILGLGGAGVAFVYKIAEFLFTLRSTEVQGFADVPVTVYFVVATGWLCLLVWCFLTGKFTDLERAKYDFLAKEAEYERQGQ
jgi:hypothetical protein